uniref:ARAD1C35662p n=1 Tax=Blastobotrys adeninivorans TaxID=409370 RepID=A0A060T3Q9_BLAAD
MGLFSDLSAWALFGGAVHHLARGIQNQPLRFRPLGYMYSAVAFVGVGLLADGVRKRQQEFRDRRLGALLDARAARDSSFARNVEPQ